MAYKPTPTELRESLNNDNKVIQNLPRRGFPERFSAEPTPVWKTYLEKTKLTAEQLYSLFRHLEREKPEFYGAKESGLHLEDIQKLILERLNKLNQELSLNMKKAVDRTKSNKKEDQESTATNNAILTQHQINKPKNTATAPMSLKPKYAPPIPSVNEKFEEGTKIYKDYEEYVQSLKDYELGNLCLQLSEEDINYPFLEKVDNMIQKRGTELGMSKIPTLRDDIKKVKETLRDLSADPFEKNPSKKNKK